MKHVPGLRRIVLAALVCTAAGVGFALAQGEIYVLESSAPSIRVGRTLVPTDRITIPDGTSIRAIMPSGKTQLIRGPYSGPAGDLAKGHQPNAGVIAWLKSLLATGGATEDRPGTTRGVRPAERAASFSWTAVPVSVDSTFCAVKGANLQLDRGPWTGAQRITVVDLAVARKGEAAWTAGTPTTAWPADVALRPDTTYTLLVPDRPQREVKLRVLDSMPGEDDVLAVLQERGCRHQFEALVKGKIKGGGS